MICSSKCIRKRNFLGFATIKGDSHKKMNMPNQDAVFAKQNKFGIALAVADGVGSHKFSQYGSKAAVRSVQEAFLSFELGEIQTSDITKTIFEIFKRKIPSKYADQSSTTCIFAYLSNKTGLYVGQIGDGLCYIKINDKFTQLKDKDDCFANLVIPLNASKETARWKTRHFNVKDSDKIEMMLATDGISGDIIPGKEEECLDYYLEKIKKTNPFWRNVIIKKQLKSWDVPGSGDDKTMIVFSKG